MLAEAYHFVRQIFGGTVSRAGGPGVGSGEQVGARNFWNTFA